MTPFTDHRTYVSTGPLWKVWLMLLPTSLALAEAGALTLLLVASGSREMFLAGMHAVVSSLTVSIASWFLAIMAGIIIAFQGSLAKTPSGMASREASVRIRRLRAGLLAAGTVLIPCWVLCFISLWPTAMAFSIFGSVVAGLLLFACCEGGGTSLSYDRRSVLERKVTGFRNMAASLPAEERALAERRPAHTARVAAAAFVIYASPAGILGVGTVAQAGGDAVTITLSAALMVVLTALVSLPLLAGYEMVRWSRISIGQPANRRLAVVGIALMLLGTGATLLPAIVADTPFDRAIWSLLLVPAALVASALFRPATAARRAYAPRGSLRLGCAAMEQLFARHHARLLDEQHLRLGERRAGFVATSGATLISSPH